jgi:hypothetical protein
VRHLVHREGAERSIRDAWRADGGNLAVETLVSGLGRREVGLEKCDILSTEIRRSPNQEPVDLLLDRFGNRARTNPRLNALLADLCSKDDSREREDDRTRRTEG